MTTPRRLSLPEDENRYAKEKPSGARRLELKKQDVSRFRSLISAFPKGAIKEIVDVPTQIRSLIGLEERPEATAVKGFAEKHLPTRDEAIEKGLERAGRTAPYLALGGGSIPSIAGRSLLSGAAGQTAEELGAGPLGQAAAEIGSLGLPGLARKIIPSTKEQKAILDLGRKYGLSEKQLAPLMPESAKRKTFGKIASKGESTEEALKETKTGISSIYNALQKHAGAQNLLPASEFSAFAQEMNKIGMSMPHALRSQLKNDAADLLKSAQARGGIAGDELMNFFHDISSRYNLGKETLQRFKGPVMEAMKKISPEAAQDFEIANKMYGRFAKMAKTLRPGEYEGLIDLGKSYAAAAALATGDLSTIGKIFGFANLRELSAKMLTSPRMQNISKQSEKAIKQHNLAMLKKLGDLTIYEVEKFQKED